MTVSINDLGNGKIAIDSPYNKEFVARVKALGARWDASGRCWVTDERNLDDVRQVLRDIYGQDDRPVVDLVTVEVVVPDGWSESRGPVTIFGRTIATAFGRDTGARVGDGVAVLEGSVSSGGSRNNWTTRIDRGSRIRIYDVPRSAVEQQVGWDDGIGTYAIVEGTDPLASLRAEREALLARLAEIDAQLAAVNQSQAKEDTGNE